MTPIAAVLGTIVRGIAFVAGTSFVANLAFAEPPRDAHASAQVEGDAEESQDGPGPTEAERAEAVRLFEEAAEHYRAGRLDAAADLLRHSYALHPEPLVLFNLARSLEGLGHFEEALEAYRGYLAADDDARDRGAVQARVETLERLVEERRQAQEAKGPPEEKRASSLDATQGSALEGNATRAEGPDEGVSLAPVVLSITGAVGLVVAGAVAGAAVARHNEWVDDESQAAAVESLESAKDLARVSNVAFAVGGALLAVGGTWLVVELASSTSEDDKTAKLGVGPGHLTMTLTF